MRDRRLAPVVKALVRALLALLLGHRGLMAGDAVVEGEALVTFKPNIAAAGAGAALERQALQMAETYDRISRHDRRLAGLVRAKGRSTAQLLAMLKADPNVETAEPNFIRRIAVNPPNDSHFSKLWGLQNTGQIVDGKWGTRGVDTNFLPAWKLARPGGGEVVVGVIDTGVNLSHPDLAANVWINPGEIAGNGIDDDGNGYLDDVHGYDFAVGTPQLSDSGDHGTHVAGTIAAVGKNHAGIIGINPRAKILTLKVSSNGTTMTTSALLAAYNYAITLKQHGVNIVALNASYGGNSFSTSEQNAMVALRDAGIIVCAAAGNDGTNNDSIPFYPAGYTTENIISVAALTQGDGLASFSNFGVVSVDLAAPGVNIYSTLPVKPATKESRVTMGATVVAAQEITFSGLTVTSGITRTIHACGIGDGGQFPSGVSGNIALIQRGTLTFAAKVTHAMAAGVVGVIIYDNLSAPLGTSNWTLGAAGNWIPALQISRASGEALLAQLVASGTLVNAAVESQSYQYLDGTSMAAPHVSGAVAFAAINDPSESVSQRVSRVLNQVTPVAALAGKTTSGGRLDLLRMVDPDGDGLPDWWETEHFGNLAETAAGDPDADGFTSLEEFLSGTLPTSAASRLAFSSSARGGSSATDFQLTFLSVEDTLYQVQRSDDLVSWSALGPPLVGTGAPLQVIDADALGNSAGRFYRMFVVP